MDNEKIQMVGYCRVSTSTQSTERQVAELEEYAKRNNVKLVRVFAEQISGASSQDLRCFKKYRSESKKAFSDVNVLLI